MAAASGCTTQARYLFDEQGDIPDYVIPTGVSQSGYAVGRVEGDGASFVTPDVGNVFAVLTPAGLGEYWLIDPADVNDRGQAIGETMNRHGLTSALRGWSSRDGQARILRSPAKQDTRPYDINEAGMIAGQIGDRAATWESWKSGPVFLHTPGLSRAKVRYLSPTGTYALGTAVGGTALDPRTYLVRWKNGKVVAKHLLPLGFQPGQFWGSDSFNKSSVVGVIAFPGRAPMPLRISVYDGALRYDTRVPGLLAFVPTALSGEAVAGSAQYTPAGGSSPVRGAVVIAPDGTVHWLPGAQFVSHLQGDTALGQDEDENVIVFTCVFAAPTSP